MKIQSSLSHTALRNNLAERVRNRQRQIQALALFPLVLTVLCGAAPPQPGTSVTGGIGYADQKLFGSCGSHRVSTLPVYGSVQHRFSNNVSITSELTSTNMKNSSLDHFSTSWSTRLGYHATYAGIELGPRLSYYSPGNQYDLFAVFPILWSVQAWAGDPENVYGYIRSFAGPQTPSSVSELLNAGVGIRRERFELEMDWPVLFALGAPTTLLALAPEIHASVRVNPEVWLGVEASSWNHTLAGPNTRVMFTLTMKPD